MPEREEVLRELGKAAAEQRENRGITLEDIYDKTRIRMEYLRGIESGDYRNFPELVYIKGFVRTYLALIGATELQDEFMKQLDRLDKNVHYNAASRRHENLNTVLKNGSAFPEGFKPASHFWLFLVLTGALIGTGVYVWYAISSGGIDLKNIKLFSFAGNNGTQIVTETLASGDIQEVSVDEDADEASGDVKSDDRKPEAPQRHSIAIRAINDVWLKVSIGTNVVYSRTMRKGDSGSWDLTAPATVIFGRPSAAQIILNGKDLGAPNPRAKRSETYIYNPDGTFRKTSK